MFVIILIAASQTTSQNLKWAIDFAQMIMQDIFLTPLIVLITQYLIIRVIESKFLKSSHKTKNFLTKQVDQVFWDVKVCSIWSIF